MHWKRTEKFRFQKPAHQNGKKGKDRLQFRLEEEDI